MELIRGVVDKRGEEEEMETQQKMVMKGREKKTDLTIIPAIAKEF